MEKDTYFHIFLISIIVGLGVVLFYYGVFRNFGDSFEDKLLLNFKKFDEEYELQETKEEATGAETTNVPIFIYHSVRPHLAIENKLLKYYTVSPQSFEKQLRYLKDNGYVVIRLEYLADSLLQKIILPPKSVVLTFDDGWENQYRYAFPFLKKYGFTATFFVFTNVIDKNPSFLTWDQVKSMDEAGMAIGGHTKSHPYLFEIKDQNLLTQEISDGKKIIEEHIKKPVTIFAYPFGHYNDLLIKMVKQAGFKAARGTYRGTHHSADDIYKLKGIEATDDFGQFIKDLNN